MCAHQESETLRLKNLLDDFADVFLDCVIQHGSRLIHPGSPLRFGKRFLLEFQHFSDGFSNCENWVKGVHGGITGLTQFFSSGWPAVLFRYNAANQDHDTKYVHSPKASR